MAQVPLPRPQSDSPSSSREIQLAGLGDTIALAGAIAGRAERGDVIVLRGDLGAGKTAFARGFIHARQRAAGLPEEEVPSPTFTLVQTYDVGAVAIWHFDLYRVGDPSEAQELGLDEALSEGIVLIEWPERLGPLLPLDRLDLELAAGEAPEARVATLIARGRRGARLAAARP